MKPTVPRKQIQTILPANVNRSHRAIAPLSSTGSLITSTSQETQRNKKCVFLVAIALIIGISVFSDVEELSNWDHKSR